MSFPTIYFRKSSFFTINKALLFSFFVILLPWKYIMKKPGWDDFEVTANHYSRVFNTKIEIYNLMVNLSIDKIIFIKFAN